MSSSFDIVQQALSTLKERVNANDEQAKLMLHYIEEAVDRWHDADHVAGDGHLNRVAYRSATLLLTVLKYEDKEERDLWLKAKQGSF